jgi:sRNA-binding protein
MALNKRQARAQAAVAELRARFPAIFTATHCRPLKVGIRDDLLAPGLDRPTVMIGLRSYCGSKAYLSALREGAARVGLDGRSIGTVDAQEATVASSQLDKKKAKPQLPKDGQLKSMTRPKTSAPAVANGPGRLSLSDLREAGRRRRGTSLSS